MFSPRRGFFVPILPSHMSYPTRRASSFPLSSDTGPTGYSAGRRRVSVFVWLRRSRRPRRVADVPRTTGWQRSRVDGTACAPHVGRPHLIGATTLSREGESQRGAHKPEYRRRETCLRGNGITNIPTRGIQPLQGLKDINKVRSRHIFSAASRTVLFDDELWVRATIDGVEIGLVEFEGCRDGIRKLRSRGRFVALDFLGLARVFRRARVRPEAHGDSCNRGGPRRPAQ